MLTRPSLCKVLEALAGEDAPFASARKTCPDFPMHGLGYSQLNELLLSLGFDRVTPAYFQFLVDGTLDSKPGSSIGTFAQLNGGVERARQLSLLLFGNIKFGFKQLASDEDQLFHYFPVTQPIPPAALRRRHDPIHPIEYISSDQTYYLGYIVDSELERRLKANPKDRGALAQRDLRDRVRQKGLRNQHAYLVSDHLDVYVATSMRRQHEYRDVGEFADRLFKSKQLRNLKLRWFDPTQAYCPDRIDKGLSEALMLKRAKCTLYLVQESDTLGKDSELASTLAQGKPVIAYLPSPSKREIEREVKRLAQLYSRPESLVILERLRDIAPERAWNDSAVRQWLDDPEKMNDSQSLELLVDATQKHYDGRAEKLMDTHPLGIQVNLETGVANGVLVVRRIEQCAELIRRIVTNSLQFRIEERSQGEKKYLLLREVVSNSVFRVMTGDPVLSNSFWNFYLQPST